MAYCMFVTLQPDQGFVHYKFSRQMLLMDLYRFDIVFVFLDHTALSNYSMMTTQSNFHREALHYSNYKHSLSDFLQHTVYYEHSNRISQTCLELENHLLSHNSLMRHACRTNCHYRRQNNTDQVTGWQTSNNLISKLLRRTYKQSNPTIHSSSGDQYFLDRQKVVLVVIFL